MDLFCIINVRRSYIAVYDTFSPQVECLGHWIDCNPTPAFGVLADEVPLMRFVVVLLYSIAKELPLSVLCT